MSFHSPYVRRGGFVRARPALRARSNSSRVSFLKMQSHLKARKLSKVRAKSKTKSKSQLKIGTAVAGVGGSFSSFKMGKFGTPLTMTKVLKQIKPQVYKFDESYQIDGSTLVSGTGVQKPSTDAYNMLYSSQHCDAIRLQAKLIAGNTVTANQGAYSTDVWHQGAQSKIFMTNTGSTTCHVVFYDIICKRNVPGGVGPVYIWSDGLTNATGGGSNRQTLVGSVPTHSDEFNTFYKVKKITKLLLPSGGSHIHRVQYNNNRRMKGWESFDNSTNAIGSLEGWTHWTIIVVHGMPQTDSTATTQTSTGQFKVDVVRSVTYHYKVISSQQSQNYYATSLGQLGGEQDMGEESNVKTAYNAA